MLLNISRENYFTQSGSSLIGVALLIIVMGTMLVGGLQLIKTFSAVKKEQESINVTTTLQDYLNNFVAIEKRYPCPALMNASPDSADFGVENCSAVVDTGDVLIGAVPVRTLRAPDKMIVDAYGKRYVYAITESLADGSADATKDSGAITLIDESNNDLTPNAEAAVYALISHGPENRGAFNIQGTSLGTCDPASLAGENCDDDETFVASLTKNYSDDAATYFTDRVVYAANPVPYRWVGGDWSNCDGICVSGTQTRDFACLDHDGNTGPDGNAHCAHTDMSFITDASGNPTTTVERACALGPCRWNVACVGGGSPPSDGGSLPGDDPSTTEDPEPTNEPDPIPTPTPQPTPVPEPTPTPTPNPLNCVDADGNVLPPPCTSINMP